MEFKDLVNERRSASKFIKGIEFTEEDMRQVYDYVKLAPSVMNLQPTNFLVVTDEEKISLMQKLHNNQYKIGVASALILVLGQKNFVDNFDEVYSPMKMLGIVDTDKYRMLEEDTIKLFGSFSEEEIKHELTINNSLTVGFLLLALKDLGWDSCPMHIMNYDSIKDIFSIPDNYEPTLMVAVGKNDGKERHRGYRFRFEDKVKFNSFV